MPTVRRTTLRPPRSASTAGATTGARTRFPPPLLRRRPQHHPPRPLAALAPKARGSPLPRRSSRCWRDAWRSSTGNSYRPRGPSSALFPTAQLRYVVPFFFSIGGLICRPGYPPLPSRLMVCCPPPPRGYWPVAPPPLPVSRTRFRVGPVVFGCFPRVPRFAFLAYLCTCGGVVAYHPNGTR